MLNVTTDDPARPVPDAKLPSLPTTLGAYDGPTSETGMERHAALFATARCAMHPLYRRSPGDCLTLLYRARALNIPVGVALDHVYINTAIGRAGLSAQLMAALLLRAGITWRTPQCTDQIVEMVFYRGRKKIGAVTWRIREAVAAGLTRREHWQLWPIDCLWARALARGCRRHFSDLVMGMGYTPEELHDMAAAEAAPEEVEQLDPVVQTLLDEATADTTTADAIRNDIVPRAKKAKKLKTTLPDGRTLEQALNEAWLVAAGREAAVHADGALTQVDPTVPTPDTPDPEVLAAPAGEGEAPCGCPTSALISGAGHVVGVCRGVLAGQR